MAGSVPIRILLVEDSETDAEQILRVLRRGGVEPDFERVETAEAMKDALARRVWDIVLSDYALPHFSGLAAIKIVKETNPDLPFILISGTIGEEVAVEAMKAGIHDYLMKDKLTRLVPAVQVALEQAEVRRKHREAEKALQEERLFVSAVLDTAGALVVVLDARGRIVRVNRECEKTMQYSIEDLKGKFVWETMPAPAEAMHVRAMFAAPRADQFPSRHESVWVAKDGESRRIACSNTALTDSDGKVRFVIVTGIDTTERRKLEEQLIHDTLHDALTGLPNRTLFLDRLGQCIRRTKRDREHSYAVLFLDLDRFKLVNDGLGHELGDQLIIEISRRLQQCIRPGDTVARLGGDEFTILLDDVRSVEAVVHATERIQAALNTPIKLGPHEIFTTASIGIAVSKPGYERPEEVLRDADAAMYRAKGAGRARHNLVDSDLHKNAVAQLQLETDLRRALEREEFVVHYQPIVGLAHGKIVGFEALVRWNQPQQGLHLPAKFVRMAEESGLIVQIDRWVMREACRQLAGWRGRFPGAGPLSMSVNLSGKEFWHADLVEEVKASVDAAGLPGESLNLEITEGVLLKSTENVIRMLNALKQTGARLYLDDFGTGYSSLSYLHNFPIDALKIDRSFVNRMKTDSDGRELVRAIIGMAHSLGISVIAEGVETEDQATQLREFECELAQGEYFSMPLRAADVEAVLLKGNGQARL